MHRCRKCSPVSPPAKSDTALGLIGLTRDLRRTGLRAQRSGHCTSAPSDVAGVSLIRPACGMENHIEETLRSAFHLDYPRYEIIFCAASANDAAAPLVRRLIAAHPHVPARLLIGNETISDNPKLNNVCKGWRAAAVRLDRHGGQQRLDAARLHRAPARGLARGYGRRQLAARGLPSAR